MDPLAQLKDIHLPQEIHNYPIAYGWWIIATMIILVVVFAIRKLVKKHQFSKAKQQAITAINHQPLSSDEIIATLKWAALQYFPRQQVAHLYGHSLQQLLVSYLPEKQQKKFTQLIQASLENQYQAIDNTEENYNNLKTAALLWLKTALPINDKKHHATNDNNTRELKA